MPAFYSLLACLIFLNVLFKGVIFIAAQNKGEGIEISYRSSMDSPTALEKVAE
jgi:hypothetical protein